MSRSRKRASARRRRPLPSAPATSAAPSPLELEAASIARRAKRERRLNGAPGVCVLCGEADLDALTHAHRTLLHDHHVAGKAHEADTLLVVCQNCHYKLHERLRNAGVLLQAQPSTLESLISVLRSRAVTFSALATADERWAERLTRLCEQLDGLEPDWRDFLNPLEDPTDA